MKKHLVILPLMIIATLFQLNAVKPISGTWLMTKSILNGRLYPNDGHSYKRINPKGTFTNFSKDLSMETPLMKGKYFVANDSVYSEWIINDKSQNQEDNINTFIYKFKGDTLVLKGSYFVALDLNRGIYGKVKMEQSWVKAE
ncbi:MAG: hypothetical protein Q8909_10470 [Bacteroidota bacterium]|nr:hypothetical protein [Bacteroidota bacterium]